jgi:hypothetical protein
MKILHLTWSRFHSQGEPIAEVTKSFEISTFRLVFGGIHIRLKGQRIEDEETFLKLHDGCLYYDGLYYSDIWVEDGESDNFVKKYPLDEFDPKKLTPSLPVNHPKVGDVIHILEDEVKIDGETMEFIIRQLGMEEQMLKQLSTDKELQGPEGARLNKRLRCIKEDVLKLGKFVDAILTEEVTSKENSDGESISRMLGNIEEACDLNASHVDTEWKDPLD